METLTGNLYDVQAEIYNGLSGAYDPELLLQECNGDSDEAAKQIVDGAISAGMIETDNVVWDSPDGTQHEMTCYRLIKGYLDRQ